MKFNAKKIKKKLDIAWSKFIRARDKTCQRCGKTGSTQAAHIFGRSSLQTRWLPTNGIGLCFFCHIYWAHREPVEFTLWVEQKIGKENFKKLRRLSQKEYPISNLRSEKEVGKILKRLE